MKNKYWNKKALDKFKKILNYTVPQDKKNHAYTEIRDYIAASLSVNDSADNACNQKKVKWKIITNLMTHIKPLAR